MLSSFTTLARRAPTWARAPLALASQRRCLDVPLHKGTGDPAPEGHEYTAATYGVESGVATITLNQPNNKNALSVELVEAVGDHLRVARADDAVRVILLTNVGNTFCAGADLKAKPSKTPPRHSLVDLFESMADSPKPVVGKIAGHCTGGGVGLSAACDISVVADDSLFGFTEVRLGVCPAVISVVTLPKMRRADASELMLTGERIPASRAVAVGLVNYAVPRAELDAKVAELIGKVVKGGPGALAASKTLVSRVPSMNRDDAFGWTAPLSGKLFRSDEAREGITAFKERRDAAWVPEGHRGSGGRA